MKILTLSKIVFFGCLALGEFRARAMGSSVVFNNRVGTFVNAPVSRPDGAGAGAGAQAQLVLVKGDGSLQPLESATTFRTTSAAAAYCVNPTDVIVPGSPGQSATLRLRAWIGGSYESAEMRGESADIVVILNEYWDPGPNLVGLTGFTMTAVTGSKNEMTLGAPAAARDQKLSWTVMGALGPVVVLEKSLDMQSWVPIVTNQVVNGSSSFTVEANESGAFFRARAGL